MDDSEIQSRDMLLNFWTRTASKTMSVQLPKGFRYLGVSEYITIGVIAIPLIISLLDLKSYFLFAWDPFISRWNQYWRLFILQLQFQNQSEVAIASIIMILYLKGLERFFGSLKLIKIIILLGFYNFLVITAMSLILSQIGINLFIPSGPFGILFSLYYPYDHYTPKTYHVEFDFRSFTNFKPLREDVIIRISDKFPAQLMFLILMFNEGICSFIVSLLGYFIGYIYFNGLVPINDDSLQVIDKIHYLVMHQAGPQITMITSDLNNHRVEHNDDDDDDDDENAASGDDTPVPPRTIGQQMMDTFT